MGKTVATTEKVIYRNYSGPCRKCKAPEMVLCREGCTYVDPWAEFYLGPGSANRIKAKKLRSENIEIVFGEAVA